MKEYCGVYFATIFMLIVTNYVNLSAAEMKPSVDEILNNIELGKYARISEDFSGLRDVFNHESDDPKIKFLIENCEKSVPNILQRFNELKIRNEHINHRYRDPRFSYFAVLGECGNIKALPIIFEYVLTGYKRMLVRSLLKGKVDNVSRDSSFGSTISPESQYSIYGYARMAFFKILRQNSSD